MSGTRSRKSASSDSAHSPGQISAVVANDVDFNSNISRETPEQHQEINPPHFLAEDILNRVPKAEPVESIKDIKLVRFNVPYIQGETQGLIQKNWEEHIAALESYLEEEKKENNRLQQIVIAHDAEIMAIKTDCEKQILNKERELNVIKAKFDSESERLKLLEMEKNKQTKAINDLIMQHKLELESLEDIIKLHQDKNEELTNDLNRIKAENEELILNNSKYTIKLEESEFEVSHIKKQYELDIIRITEEKRVAMKNAEEIKEKYYDIIAESEENLGRSKQYHIKCDELKIKIKLLNEHINNLEEENMYLKSDSEVYKNCVETLKDDNEMLKKRIAEIININTNQYKQSQIEENKAKEIKQSIPEATKIPQKKTHNLTMIEKKYQKKNEIYQEATLRMKTAINEISKENDISYTERNVLQRQLFEERAKYKNLLKDFQSFEQKVEAEAMNMESRIKSQQKEIWEKDSQLQQLKDEIESIKKIIDKTKGMYHMNSYLRNLPTSELWLEDPKEQEKMYKSIKKTIDNFDKADTRKVTDAKKA